MKGTVSRSHILKIVLIVGGSTSMIGCGAHPDEGTLKFAPGRREAREVSKETPTQPSPTARKNRKDVKEVPVGK